MVNSSNASKICSLVLAVLIIILALVCCIIFVWLLYSSYMVLYYPLIDKSITDNTSNKLKNRNSAYTRLSFNESMKLLWTLRTEM